MIYPHTGHNAGQFTGERLEETPGTLKKAPNVIDVEEVKPLLLLKDKPKEEPENPS